MAPGHHADGLGPPSPREPPGAPSLTRPDPLPAIPFRSELRPTQARVAEIARRMLEEGGRRLHVVAPPGSGKTILGLYLWAREVRRPALVLSPNSAIQAQWAARTDLFEVPADVEISTDPDAPGDLTSLTYQAVTLPSRGSSDLDRAAVARWEETLVEKGEARDPAEAAAWIEDLARHNPDYHGERLSVYRKEVRDERAREGDALEILHASSRETLDRVRARGVGLVILDECHHLTGHWGRVLADVTDHLDDPVVCGLTATPPDLDDVAGDDAERYLETLGPVDHEVPVPAVVKDGFLAPYQDLVFFCRPTAEELSFVAGVDREWTDLVERLTDPAIPSEPLVPWLRRTLATRELPGGPVETWADFERADPGLAAAGPRFLLRRGGTLPEGVIPPPGGEPVDPLADATTVIDRYVRRYLRPSPEPSDHELAEEAIRDLRHLGVQITETGSRACASPVTRVLARSQAKARALVPILRAEREALGERIRAVVVTDHERTSAIQPELEGVLDEEAGGAVAAFRTLVSEPSTDALDPILVTGSTVLVDDDLAPTFLEEAQAWLEGRDLRVELEMEEADGFRVVRGRGTDWSSRHYVLLVTELFERGVTRCLVGTRGLLGEGWDAKRANVLCDLTWVTTSMSVNQLRGRTIRLDPSWPEKLADNWDVCCIAPELARGLDDYRRFAEKHRALLGVTEDGAVESGVGHVHAAFGELEPAAIEESMAALNEEMLGRPARREELRELWAIGEPYDARPRTAIEASLGEEATGGFPPFSGRKEAWTGTSLALAVGRAILGAFCELGEMGEGAAPRVGERAGGYVRVFLENAPPASAERFAKALRQALGPLDRPRYIVPRRVTDVEETWLSNLLPSIVGRYFERRSERLLAWHAVPDELARNREICDVYARHWNAFVSPGEPVYCLRGEGETVLEEARREGLVPGGTFEEKEVWT